MTLAVTAAAVAGAAPPTSPRPSHPAPVPAPARYPTPVRYQTPARYQFEYSVADRSAGLEFGQEERRGRGRDERLVPRYCYPTVVTSGYGTRCSARTATWLTSRTRERPARTTRHRGKSRPAAHAPTPCSRWLRRPWWTPLWILRPMQRQGMSRLPR